jgi:hypothetical protein
VCLQVYFDTIAFANTPKHSYAKLLPEAFSDKDALLNNMRESEGELSMGNFTVSDSLPFFASSRYLEAICDLVCRRNAIPLISRCGSRRKAGNRSGTARGAKVSYLKGENMNQL